MCLCIEETVERGMEGDRWIQRVNFGSGRRAHVHSSIVTVVFHVTQFYYHYLSNKEIYTIL